MKLKCKCIYVYIYIYMISIDVGFARIGKYLSDIQLFVNLESGDNKKSKY